MCLQWIGVFFNIEIMTACFILFRSLACLLSLSLLFLFRISVFTLLFLLLLLLCLFLLFSLVLAFVVHVFTFKMRYIGFTTSFHYLSTTAAAVFCFHFICSFRLFGRSLFCCCCCYLQFFLDIAMRSLV